LSDLNDISQFKDKSLFFFPHLAAIQAPVRKYHGHDKVADGKLETCDWIHEGDAVLVKFEKKFQVYGIQMICPAPYKGTFVASVVASTYLPIVLVKYSSR